MALLSMLTFSNNSNSESTENSENRENRSKIYYALYRRDTNLKISTHIEKTVLFLFYQNRLRNKNN